MLKLGRRRYHIHWVNLLPHVVMCLIYCSSAGLPDTINPTVAVAAFQSQQAVLLEGIHSNLTTLATKLLAEFVINRDIHDKACNERNGKVERSLILLSCIQDRMKTEPAVFTKVVDIFESEPTLTHLASQLVDGYCELMKLY